MVGRKVYAHMGQDCIVGVGVDFDFDLFSTFERGKKKYL
jgi:hypothetical protein